MQTVFSYPLVIEELSANLKEFNIKTNPEQNQYLAEVLKIEALKSLNADILIKYNKKAHLLELDGNIKANCVLKSVISLELFDKTYNFEFKMIYDTKMTYEQQKELMEKGDDFQDIVIGGKIDLVDVMIEQLALNIEEHPRKKGEQFDFYQESVEETQEKHNPFEVLAKIK